ncbi:MAG TPA: hypothetical protein VJS66_05320 [Burkholderiales bacterium]|nr:hypothetical protein [Burkholderiales bacterium]
MPDKTAVLHEVAATVDGESVTGVAVSGVVSDGAAIADYVAAATTPVHPARPHLRGVVF